MILYIILWKAHIEQNVITFSPVFFKMPLRLQAFNHFGGASQHHPGLSWSHRQLLKMYSSFKSFILLVVVLPVSEKKKKEFYITDSAVRDKEQQQHPECSQVYLNSLSKFNYNPPNWSLVGNYESLILFLNYVCFMK